MAETLNVRDVVGQWHVDGGLRARDPCAKKQLRVYS